MKLKLSDILVTVVISILFGVVYKLWAPVYYAVKPIGLHIEQLVYGMWLIAAVVAFLLIRKPGVALLAEIAAASGEFLTGSEWGLEVLLYGVVQGIFAELIFFLFRYKRFGIGVASLAAVSSAFGSIVMDFFRGNLMELATWNLVLFLAARFLGAILIAGFFAYSIVRSLEATGITTILRPVSKREYDQL